MKFIWRILPYNVFIYDCGDDYNAKREMAIKYTRTDAIVHSVSFLVLSLNLMNIRRAIYLRWSNKKENAIRMHIRVINSVELSQDEMSSSPFRFFHFFRKYIQQIPLEFAAIKINQIINNSNGHLSDAATVPTLNNERRRRSSEFAFVAINCCWCVGNFIHLQNSHLRLLVVNFDIQN